MDHNALVAANRCSVMRGRFKTGLALLLALAVVATATDSLAQRKKRERERERPAPSQPVDKRDRVVNATGTPFHGRPFWLAMAQCGGIYFRLSTLYEEAAIQVRAAKPDPKLAAQSLAKAAQERKRATAFFVAAEGFLMADRGMAKEEAILTYDPRAWEAGERLKSIEAAVQAARACPALYRACTQSFGKLCPEASAVAALRFSWPPGG